MSTACDYPLGAEAKDMIEDEWAVSQVRRFWLFGVVLHLVLQSGLCVKWR